MTMPMVLGTATPYITPDQLQREPIGIAWSSLVPPRSMQSSSNDLNIVLQDICQQATALVDNYCNQVLRATLNTEEIRGPDLRVTVDSATGEALCIMSRKPVLQVTGVKVSPSAVYPRQWTSIPAGYFEPYPPVIGVYGSSSPADAGEGGSFVLIAPGFVTWANGRNGFRVNISYINGWPHTSLTAQSAAGATTITVDDCTGWAPVAAGQPGAVGILYDGALQESIAVTTASQQSGPGTLTLQNALKYKHNAGVMVTTLPNQVIWATALFAGAQALTRGATTTTIHAIGGGSAQGSNAPTELSAEAELALVPFKRVL